MLFAGFTQKKFMWCIYIYIFVNFYVGIEGELVKGRERERERE